MNVRVQAAKQPSFEFEGRTNEEYTGEDSLSGQVPKCSLDTQRVLE